MSKPQECMFKIFTTLGGSGLGELFKIEFSDGHSAILTHTPSDPSGVKQSLSSKIIKQNMVNQYR